MPQTTESVISVTAVIRIIICGIYAVSTVFVGKDVLCPDLLALNKAVLFGSYAKGTATEHSDIDLLVDSGLRLKFFGLLESINLYPESSGGSAGCGTN